MKKSQGRLTCPYQRKTMAYRVIKNLFIIYHTRETTDNDEWVSYLDEAIEHICSGHKQANIITSIGGFPSGEQRRHLFYRLQQLPKEKMATVRSIFLLRGSRVMSFYTTILSHILILFYFLLRLFGIRFPRTRIYTFDQIGKGLLFLRIDFLSEEEVNNIIEELKLECSQVKKGKKS